MEEKTVQQVFHREPDDPTDQETGHQTLDRKGMAKRIDKSHRQDQPPYNKKYGEGQECHAFKNRIFEQPDRHIIGFISAYPTHVRNP